MSYDISQPVSQGSSGEETSENRRILEVADELRRRCQLYEAQLRDGQDNVIMSDRGLIQIKRKASLMDEY